MDWQGVAYGLACCLIRGNQAFGLRMDWQGVAYGLACCLIREMKRLVAYGLARRLRIDWHAV